MLFMNYLCDLKSGIREACAKQVVENWKTINIWKDNSSDSCFIIIIIWWLWKEINMELCENVCGSVYVENKKTLTNTNESQNQNLQHLYWVNFIQRVWNDCINKNSLYSWYFRDGMICNVRENIIFMPRRISQQDSNNYRWYVDLTGSIVSSPNAWPT